MPPRRRCTACRISQKYCDQERPKCGRCTAKSATCVYQDANELIFVDQNRTSVQLSRRAARRNNRTIRTTHAGVHELGVSHQDISTDTRPGPGCQPPFDSGNFCNQPLWSLDDRVLARFFSRWAARQTFISWQTFIPTLYERSGPDSAMYCAILAAAYADLAVFERHGDRSLKSYQSYLGTLRRIQCQLDEPNAVMSDTIFAAVLVIDSFEILYMIRPTALGVHTKAIARLLELHRQNCSNDQLKFELERAAYPRIPARQILSYTPSLSNCIRDSVRATDNAFDIRIANFVASACDMLSLLKIEQAKSMTEQIDQQRTRDLSVLLWSLMKETGDWLEHCPTVPKLTRVALKLYSDSDWPSLFDRSSILASNRLWHARNWLLFHMCCITISDALIDLQADCVFQNDRSFSSAENGLLPDTETCLATLNESCEFILDTAPFIMGLADEHGEARSSSLNDTGLLIVYYPLWTISESRNKSPDANRQASILLQFIEEKRKIIGPL